MYWSYHTYFLFFLILIDPFKKNLPQYIFSFQFFQWFKERDMQPNSNLVGYKLWSLWFNFFFKAQVAAAKNKQDFFLSWVKLSIILTVIVTAKMYVSFVFFCMCKHIIYYLTLGVLSNQTWYFQLEFKGFIRFWLLTASHISKNNRGSDMSFSLDLSEISVIGFFNLHFIILNDVRERNLSQLIRTCRKFPCYIRMCLSI